MNRNKSTTEQFLDSIGPIRPRFIMGLILYVDESGTHDNKGIRVGSRTPVIAGYIDRTEAWEFFCKEWKAVLDAPQYKIEYFHFSDLHVDKRADKESPYFGWSESKIRDFLYDFPHWRHWSLW